MVVVLAACGPTRVTVKTVPRPTTTLEAEQLYAQYGVAGVRQAGLVMGGPARVLESSVLESPPEALVLNNGTEIEDPRDLIPVVPPTSNFVGLANEWAAGRAKWTVPGTVASVSSALGFGGLIASLVTINQAKSAVPTVVSLVLLIVGPIVSLSIGKAIAPDVNKLLSQSFHAYFLEIEGLKSFSPPPNAPPPESPSP